MEGKPRILIVEDEHIIYEYLKILFELQDYIVDITTDGKNIHSIIKTFNPHIIILDIKLPGKVNGFEILRKLKKSHSTKDIIVVIYTVRAEQKDKELALNLGADYYITKPITGENLLKIIQSITDKI